MKNVALITGASSGIGKELAQIHAKCGGDLVLVARREDKLIELKSELEKNHSIKALVMAKDLTQPQAPREIHSAVEEQGIEIKFLINNAGFGGHGLFWEREWAEDLSMIQLNVIALSELCRLFLPDFVKRGRGGILNVSSTASLPPGGPLQSVYFATKHFVTALSYGLAGELEGTKVTVTNLMPGPTATEFAATANVQDTKSFSMATSARAVAEEGYRGLLEGKLEVISGFTFTQKMMSAAIPFLPKKMILSQIKKLQEVGS